MRIVLVFPKWTDKYGITAKISEKISIYPPLQLAYLAAQAEKLGHDVYIIDGQVEKLSFNDLTNKIISLNPDIVGITATTPFFQQATDLAAELKKLSKHIAICIGGYHITVLKEEAFKDCFDYGFIGEADLSWPKFLIGYEKSCIPVAKGIIYRDADGIKITGEPIQVGDLDALPLPSRHLLRMGDYRVGTSEGNKRFASVFTTRGCPYFCIFCTNKVMGKKVRRRDYSKVADEVESIINHFRIRHIVFLDDTFTLNREYTIDLCNEIIYRNLNITFECGTRADLVDEELISLMRKAGLIRISFGYESADHQIRQIAKKTVPLESYDKVCKIAYECGIDTRLSGILGLPGETKETANKTIYYLANNRYAKEIQYSIAVPYPGSELYEMANRGDYGLKLLSDFSGFRRYNTSAMESKELTVKDLVEIQNDAYIKIYCKIWRWKTIFKHMGIWGIIMISVRFFNKLKWWLKRNG